MAKSLSKRTATILPSKLSDLEIELVENLDVWHVFKGKPGAEQYGEKVTKKVEELAKRNANVIMKSQSTGKLRRKRTGTAIINKLVLDTKGDNYTDILRVTQKSLASNFESTNMDYEATIEYKYKQILDKLEKKRALQDKLVSEKTLVLENLAKFKRQIMEARSTDRICKQSLSSEERTGQGETKIGTLHEAMMQHERRLVEIKKCEEEISRIRKIAEDKSLAIGEVNKKIEAIKYEAAKLREEQCEHFHKLLSEGIDTRQEGFAWIIKAIWGLNKNVNISKIPAYLDEKAIKYVFDVRCQI